jgi:hypothetical protein
MWDEDEILSLEEAACLFWPTGPLSVRSLRTAADDGDLAVVWIARKIFTTPGAIRDMTKCSPNKKPGADRAAASTEVIPAPEASPQPPALSESAQALLRKIAEERARMGPRRNRRY